MAMDGCDEEDDEVDDDPTMPPLLLLLLLLLSILGGGGVGAGEAAPDRADARVVEGVGLEVEPRISRRGDCSSE